MAQSALLRPVVPAFRTKTLTTVRDVDAIKTTIATAATAQTYSGAALNGALGGTIEPAMTVSVSTAAAAGAYNLSGIVFTGTHPYQNAVQTETLTLTQVNGNEIVLGSLPFRTVTQIYVPAMALLTGSFTFGVEVLYPYIWQIVECRAGADGNLSVVYDGAYTDTLPLKTQERVIAMVAKVDGATTTAQPLTVYMHPRAVT